MAKHPPSTQQSINIAGIKDGVMVMKDGSYRLVLQVAATNFSLKSEQEQNSIIFQYQSFLNSLHFPIEIVISSRRLDLTPYIAKIDKLRETQTSELLSMQTADYAEFLKKLIEIANIMKKTFYVVVPYEPISIKKMTFLDSFMGKRSTFDHLKISDLDYKSNTEQLKQRATAVASGLGSMGLHCFQLTTEDLIELFYLMYNPDEASKERFQDATLLASPVIMSESEKIGAAPEAGLAPVAPSPESGEDEMIDNTAIVQARRKEETAARKAEEDKVAATETKPATNAPSAPAAASPSTVPPAPAQPAAQPPQGANPTVATTPPTSIPPAPPTPPANNVQ